MINTQDVHPDTKREFDLLTSDLISLPILNDLENLVKWRHRILGYLFGENYFTRKRGTENYKAHSLRVAERSYKLAVRYNADRRACARAGILHDVCKIEGGRRMGVFRYIPFIGDGHAKYGAEFARGMGESNVVINAIRRHMFPMSYSFPRTKEDWIVWIADKLDSIYR